MAISKCNPGGFSANDKLTSAQISAIDTNTTYGADKRAGQTDTIESIWTMANGGRIVPSVTTGSDSNATVQPGASTNLIRYASGTLTANRSATLGTTGVVSGDIIAFEIEGGSYEVTIKDQASATMFTLGVLDSSDGAWFEAIYLGSSWRPYRRPQARERSQTFTSNGTFVVPPGVTELFLIGCGGGGGGGSGSAGFLNAVIIDPLRRALGSGGGGGALRGVQRVAVTPLSSQAVVIGTGGAGASVDGAAGSDGADTTFGSLATFRGAMGGLGSGTSVDDDSTRVTFGGGNMRGAYVIGSGSSKIPSSTVLGSMSGPSFGGLGTCVAGGTGNYSPEGNAGGTGGAQGGDGIANYRGGGGGGGGAGGAFGAGTNGGSGGYGSSTANAQDGFNASNASANTGAGGGGGGGGGQALDGIGTVGGGGNGGDGGSGKLIVVWFK